jgi:ankyrin repeat protein
LHASPTTLSAHDDVGDTLLHIAARAGSARCVRALLTLPNAADALVCVNASGETPLAAACARAGASSTTAVSKPKHDDDNDDDDYEDDDDDADTIEQPNYDLVIPLLTPKSSDKASANDERKPKKKARRKAKDIAAEVRVC